MSASVNMEVIAEIWCSSYPDHSVRGILLHSLQCMQSFTTSGGSIPSAHAVHATVCLESGRMSGKWITIKDQISCLYLGILEGVISCTRGTVLARICLLRADSQVSPTPKWSRSLGHDLTVCLGRVFRWKCRWRTYHRTS
jgi:hypothetical protein